ncbi:MAG: SDR family oxidoreductase [Pseudomonadota bacterium]
MLITGANGFVGNALCKEAVVRGIQVRAATRTPSTFPGSIESVVVGQTDGQQNWSDALRDVDVAVHLAARVHVMHDDAADSLAEFRKVNVLGTVHFARQAVSAGIKRLVYVSSIKVNGEETSGGHIYSELDVPDPQDPYGLSKWEAEQALWDIAKETGMEVVVVRPPLVYGAGVKGNFAQMMRVVARGIPLPLGSVHNQRDLIYVGNLVDALIACATHPAAAGQSYLVSDGDAVSTPQLLRNLANALGVPSRVFAFPPVLLKLAGQVFGKSMQVERLLGSLQVGSVKIRRELNWKPPYDLQEGLAKTVAAAKHR